MLQRRGYLKDSLFIIEGEVNDINNFFQRFLKGMKTV